MPAGNPASLAELGKTLRARPSATAAPVTPPRPAERAPLDGPRRLGGEEPRKCDQGIKGREWEGGRERRILGGIGWGNVLQSLDVGVSFTEIRKCQIPS